METQTLVAFVGMGGALVGSAVGGLISYFSSRSVRKLEWELSLVQKEIHARETLYADFLTEAGRLLLHQVENKSHPATEMTNLIALDARIWFYSDAVGKCSRKITVCVVDGNYSDDQEKGEEKKEKPTFAALRDDFITECKKDLEALKRNA